MKCFNCGADISGGSEIYAGLLTLNACDESACVTEADEIRKASERAEQDFWYEYRRP